MEAEGLLAPVDITLPIGFLPGEFTRYLTQKFIVTGKQIGRAHV